MKNKVKYIKLISIKDEMNSIPVAKGILICGGVSSHYNMMNIEEIIGKLRPIIISETEKIEEGDWYYNTADDAILNKTSLMHIPTMRKILALPEHFSTFNIKDILNGKFKYGDELYITTYSEKIEGTVKRDTTYQYYIQLDELNNIIIHQVEDLWDELMRDWEDASLNMPSNHVVSFLKTKWNLSKIVT